MTSQEHGAVKINGSSIILMHTVCASMAFLAALAIGYHLHFIKIVTNAHYSYPDEWWPSVSATIGDRYPERSVFQILIALTSFPRFCLLLTHFFLTQSKAQFVVGVLRTVTCGGWVYITSTDDHDSHDVFMISYIILTLPWNVLCINNSKPETKKYKKLACFSFFGTLVPLIYWFIQHEVKVRPGAYSIYAYFEWSLIMQDILFDALSYKDFCAIDLIFQTSGIKLVEHHDESMKADKEIDEKTTSQNADTIHLVDEDDEDDEESDPEYVDSDIADENDETEVLNIVEIEKDAKALLQEEQNLVSVPPFMDTTAHFALVVYQSFMLWTSLTALLCIIWHFPLWYMGISGYEAGILSVLLSALMYLPYSPQIMHQYGSLLITFTSLGSYLVTVPEKRLITIGFGVGLACMNLVYNFQYALKSKEAVRKFSIAWCLGLALSVILKMGNYSNNPLWPIMFEENGGWNKTGIFLSTVVSFISPTLIAPPFASNCNTFLNTEKKHSLCVKKVFDIVVVAFGFGSLIFATHQLLTDASTIIYWSWEGYKIDEKPLLQWPWSFVTCAFMVLSSVLLCRNISQNKALIVTLLVFSTYVLSNPAFTSFSNYFFGGLPYIVGLILAYSYYFQQLFRLQSIAAFTLAFFVYDILILAHVWTVAYAFVPFGWVLRERIEYVLSASTGLIVLGIICTSSKALPFLVDSNLNKLCLRVSVFLLVLASYFTYTMQPNKTDPEPYHPNKNLCTAGIWTIHFGLDNDMWASEQRMIDLLQDLEVDVVGLLETDTQRITMGNRDLTNKMAHDLNMYADYGPGPNKHTWGCVLLSKFPILNSTHHLLPSPVGELAPAIHATLDMYGEPVDVFVFHSGQEEDEEDRRLQTQELTRLMGSVPEGRPTLLLSYLVTDPHEGNYNTYVSEQSGMHDIEPADDDRWCEYILYKNLKRTGYARVHRGTITDTELQVGKFQILSQNELKEYGDELIYQSHKVESLHDDEFKFPDMFLEDGERGHYYHVFDKPYYYDFDLSHFENLEENPEYENFLDAVADIGIN